MIGVVVWSGYDSAVIWCQDRFGLAYVKNEGGVAASDWPQTGDLVEYDAVANDDGGLTLTAVCVITQGPAEGRGAALALCG